MSEEAWSPRMSSPEILPASPPGNIGSWSNAVQRVESGRISSLARSTVTTSPSRTPVSPNTDSLPAVRASQQRRNNSSGQVPALSLTEPYSPPLTVFDPPLRSIFVSGPPTASVSANTAHASLSAATNSNGSGSLAAFSNAGGYRRNAQRSSENVVPSTSAMINPRPPLFTTEKDVDDPTSNFVSDYTLGLDGSTSTTINRLFGVNSGSGHITREPSQLQTLSAYSRNSHETDSLAGHLLQHGFKDGKHSDIKILAFNREYRLHKLLLDRVPFFSSAFSGSWVESSAQEMSLQPKEIDVNITQTAFELALKQIYGTPVTTQENVDTVGLFAVACWLDMPELVEHCVETIIRDMAPSNLHNLIRLVTNNYYGKSGERILASTKAMLCREGWQMPIEHWDEIPAEIVREIVGGDPFFVPGEWDRWLLALKLLNQRLRHHATRMSLVGPEGYFLHVRPISMRHSAIRPAMHSQQSLAITREQPGADHENPWIALYLCPDIAPLLKLLDEGVHYTHLRFEQLQQIRAQRDLLGVPVLPEKIIADALWMSMELRQRILNAHENDLELGLAEELPPTVHVTVSETETTLRGGRGKQREDGSDLMAHNDTDEHTWSGPGQDRRFWIPSTDVSCVMGGTREACLAVNSTNCADWSTQSARISAGLNPVEVPWAVDSISNNITERRVTPNNLTSAGRAMFSPYPPFRFSAEFPNPRALREKKRVYSQTVWYAGSLWNLYIQRVNSSTGIFLHRAKDKDPSGDPLAQYFPSSVDDRIGRLEREMLLRTVERKRQQRQFETTNPVDSTQDDDSGDSGAESESNTAVVGTRAAANSASAATLDSKNGGVFNVHKVSHTPNEAAGVSASTPPQNSDIGRLPDVEEEDAELRRMTSRFNVPVIPAYVDSRQVIKTYFKIYSPEKAGRLLSIYESAPEKFVVSKSWGWKGNQMMLDDRIGGHESSGGGRDGKLRYMVVIGNV